MASPKSYEEIARALPVNKSFTLKEFAEFTGFKEDAAKQRIWLMYKKLGFIGKYGKLRSLKYFITEKNRADMIAESPVNAVKKSGKGKKRGVAKEYINPCNQDVYLKSVGFY